MSPETLITILSFAVAIYALLPLERALDLRVKLAWYDLVVVLAALLVVLYILYQPVLEEQGWALDLGRWRWGFDASLTTFSVIFVAAIWVVLRLHFGGLRRKRIEAFSRLATGLLQQRKNGELAEMLKRYLPQLMKIYENRYPIVRLRNWLAPPSWEVLAHRRNKTKEWPKAVQFAARLLSRLLPTHEGTREAAQQSVHRILLSDHFVESMAAAYPYMAIDGV